MGIIGNNFRLNTGVHRSFGEVMSRTNGNAQRYSSFCNTRSQMGNTVVYSLTATPIGSNPETSFYPPQTSGGMALRSISSSNLTATLIPELLMEIDFTGSGELDATASLTIAMLCAMTGNGNLTADIVGVLNASIDFTGSGDLSADVKGVGQMAIDMLGNGDLEAAIAAYGNMSIDITVTGTGLSTANVGAAVWSAIAAQNNVSGTMGEKLNDAGSASNPWTEVIEGTYTAAEVLRLLSAVAAGKTTIVDHGGGLATVTFRDINDTVNRVVAEMDNSERTSVTKNL